MPPRPEKILSSLDYLSVFRTRSLNCTTIGGPAWICSASTPSFAPAAVFVGHVDGLLAVDEVLQVVALGDDLVLVPVLAS